MQIHKLGDQVEFEDKKFGPRVLMNRPGYRLVHLNLRSGQSIPEHTTKEMVTVYAISGHVTFYENKSPFELHAGEVLFIEAGVSHGLEAHEDSKLIVVAAGSSAPAANPELDLRQIPRPQRHPLVFAKFDALNVGESFELVNDHDPIPLYRQMDTLRPGQAVWSYLDPGPETFRIRILRVAGLNDASLPAPVQPEELQSIQR